uniref:HDC16436 n=1 Tax=Drosophila melanogaster TaxID=7227 RepID=Q6IIZ7_DROME|nr:TPA_inf: HDC16436 [Drosophila melanogaster]
MMGEDGTAGATVIYASQWLSSWLRVVAFHIFPHFLGGVSVLVRMLEHFLVRSDFPSLIVADKIDSSLWQFNMTFVAYLYT